MSNSRNWVAQKDCPYAAGSVDITTGATPEQPGDATFTQAFGAGPIDVFWSLEDASDPPKKMAGIGSLSGGSIDVSSPTSTFDGTTYDNSPSGVITLTSPVIIRCVLSGEEYDSYVAVSETYIVATDGASQVYSYAHESADILQVTYNGNLLRNGSDYTTDSSANTITMAFDNVAGDDILVTKYGKKTNSGATDLSNAEFPDYAIFGSEVDNGSSTSAIDFATGNNQTVTAVTSTNEAFTVASPTGKPGHFMLKIVDSGNLASIAPAAGGSIHWPSNTPPVWAGVTLLSLYYNGTDWYGSGLPDVRNA